MSATRRHPSTRQAAQERCAQYGKLRRAGVDPITAGEQLRVSWATAERYERWFQAGVDPPDDDAEEAA